MGGISGLLISLLAILVSPVSQHSFYVKAARKLFIAKSKKEGLFAEVPKEKLTRAFDEDLIKS